MTYRQISFYLLLFSFFTQCSIRLTAQSGDFILSHHAPKHSEIDNVNFEITSDQNGIICIANRFGVLKYDGKDWDFYKTNSSALSLAIAEDNTIYVGCLGEFGKIDFKENDYQYVTIFEEDTVADHFLQTHIANGLVYFLSDSKLFLYDPINDETKSLFQGNFYNGYVLEDVLYINTANDTVLKVENGKISESEPEKFWGLISTSPNGKHQFAVDLNGGLYQSKNGKLEPHAQYDKFLGTESIITDLVWVTDSLLACSTYESGVFFLHPDDTSYFEVTDYHSGLPDNEIYDMYADNSGGVWVAHEFGLTRIDPLFPAHSYTNFPGLEGNLIEARRIHNDLWVNTSRGVFFFDQDTSYRSRVYIEKLMPKSASKQLSTDQQAETNQVYEEENKKGFLKGLFKKKDRAKEIEKNNQERFLKKIFTGKENISQSEEAQYVRRVERIVSGISYHFSHVPGSDGKFQQLMETADRILATSHTGIYEIEKTSAQLVINEAVQYAYIVPGTNQLLISTENGQVKYYQLVDEIWTEFSVQSFNDIILNVYMDSHELVWLAGTTHIYQGRFTAGIFAIEHTYEINNRFYDELSVWEHSNNLYFINSQGYFRFDRESDHIVKDTELEAQLGEPHHHLHNEKSKVWMYNGKNWNLLNPDGSVEEFHYLGVFPDLKYINYDEVTNRYWLVTEDNQLLAYDPTHKIKLDNASSLFVKRIYSEEGELRVKRNFELDYYHNTLNIELLKPDYMGFLNPEYQYKLKGLNEEWSAWTGANLIDFSYLPPGGYELIVRVRDALGELEENTLLQFSVATPYWQQPWFYAVQVIVLAMIIGTTSRLDKRKRQNRIIKQGLSVLTLVVIIEFLQSVIGGYLDITSTPVMDFLVDAGIAIMVFPLEWLLRKLILEGGLGLSKRVKSA
ncbi:MAG: triple tyrosine motif-containing protein [Bacteroidota bacterium]